VSITHIIFDCDGVLVDSEPLSMRADAELLAKYGLKLSAEDLSKRFVGTTFEAMMQALSKERGVEFPADLHEQKNLLMNDLYRRELKVVRGVRDALDSIKGMGLTMSIASNGPKERVKLALQITGLLHHFKDQIVTYEDVPKGKPEPDMFLLAAKLAKVKPEDCLVVEDSITGVTAAVDAGCWTLGFTGTHENQTTHGEKLKDIGAEATFATMGELPSLVSTFIHET
jgi:HAD superfamily hydrolase (TIGR01509 family)